MYSGFSSVINCFLFIIHSIPSPKVGSYSPMNLLVINRTVNAENVLKSVKNKHTHFHCISLNFDILCHDILLKVQKNLPTLNKLKFYKFLTSDNNGTPVLPTAGWPSIRTRKGRNREIFFSKCGEDITRNLKTIAQQVNQNQI